MKKNSFHRGFTLLLIFGLSALLKIESQIDTLFIDSNFQQANLKQFSLIKNSAQNSHTNETEFFYFGFENTYNTIDFTIKNKLQKNSNLILQFTYVYIQEIVLSKIVNNQIIPVYKTGTAYNLKTKPKAHRLFSLPIKLQPNETASFQLKLKKEKGKPLATSAIIKSEKNFENENFKQQLLIGAYFGISILSVVFSLFIFYFLKQSVYLIYAIYVVFLGLFISSYIGVFSQVFLSENHKVDKYLHYVLFSEISLILFAVFSQKILEAKAYTPKLKKGIEVLLVVIIILRLLLHFFFTEVFENAVSIFMKIWYAIFIVLIGIIIVQIIMYYRKNNARTSFFALAYIFMILGTAASILYHSFGILNTYFYDLPMLFYTSILEVLFLTFTVIFMVKDIYDDRNTLSKAIVIQEKKNLTAFIKGEDKERLRIGKELHDNIGSQLSYLKRVVSDKFKDKNVEKTIDNICDDVRALSHEISPSSLKFVGFKNTVKELANNISEQTSLNLDFNSHNFPENLPEDVSTQLYRVVQEGLNNILKHSKATQVDIQLMLLEDSLSISIEDDGIGFESRKDKPGLGLKNMQSRVQQIGGNLSIDSSATQGTLILITIPYKTT